MHFCIDWILFNALALSDYSGIGYLIMVTFNIVFCFTFNREYWGLNFLFLLRCRIYLVWELRRRLWFINENRRVFLVQTVRSLITLCSHLRRRWDWLVILLTDLLSSHFLICNRHTAFPCSLEGIIGLFCFKIIGLSFANYALTLRHMSIDFLKRIWNFIWIGSEKILVRNFLRLESPWLLNWGEWIIVRIIYILLVLCI